MEPLFIGQIRNINHSNVEYIEWIQLNGFSHKRLPVDGWSHVNVHDAFSSASDCLLNPSAKPSPSTSEGFLLHIGHSLFRSCEALIQMMRFQRWPLEMGRAPCMCWPRWRRPSVTLCSTSVHSVSFTGTCMRQQKEQQTNVFMLNLTPVMLK